MSQARSSSLPASQVREVFGRGILAFGGLTGRRDTERYLDSVARVMNGDIPITSYEITDSTRPDIRAGDGSHDPDRLGLSWSVRTYLSAGGCSSDRRWRVRYVTGHMLNRGHM